MRIIRMICISSLILWQGIFAQDEKEAPVYGWEKEVVGNVNFTQNSFDNWTQGGEDSWSWALDVRSKFIHDQERFNWSNSGRFAYGNTKIGGGEARKAADEIKFESVYTRKWGVYINPYVAVSGLTQFAPGYFYGDTVKTEISNLLDPGYFTESIGLGYEPVKNFKTRLGAAMKQTLTDRHPQPYADDPGTTKIEKFKNELGIESVTDYSQKLNQIVLFTSKLELFSNAQRLDEVDINWDNLFSAKVSKYVTVSFNVKLFYDKDISVKRQLQQTLAVGLSYTFI